MNPGSAASAISQLTLADEIRLGSNLNEEMRAVKSHALGQRPLGSGTL
jgi:hypothetical protein